jgi:hypothetical protein
VVEVIDVMAREKNRSGLNGQEQTFRRAAKRGNLALQEPIDMTFIFLAAHAGVTLKDVIG